MSTAYPLNEEALCGDPRAVVALVQAIHRALKIGLLSQQAMPEGLFDDDALAQEGLTIVSLTDAADLTKCTTIVVHKDGGFLTTRRMNMLGARSKRTEPNMATVKAPDQGIQGATLQQHAPSTPSALTLIDDPNHPEVKNGVTKIMAKRTSSELELAAEFAKRKYAGKALAAIEAAINERRNQMPVTQ